MKYWLLVFPVFTHVFPKAFANFLAMMLNAGRYETAYKFHVFLWERGLIHDAMNRALEAALASPECAGIITFDDDCIPPIDAIPRLLRHYEAGCQMVSGVGIMRQFPFTTTVGRYYPEGPTIVVNEKSANTTGFYWLDDLASYGTGLIDVDFSGFPITLISREVLEKVEKPAFQHYDKWGGASTHDIDFCKKAKAAGFKVWVDTTISCGHIVEAPVVSIETRNKVRDYVNAQSDPPKAA